MFSNLMAIKSPERKVYGIDLDETKIDWAQKTIGNRKNIKFEVSDLNSLKIPEVDAIILYDVMHHIEEKAQLNILKECYEKLSVEGRFILKENDVVPKWKLFVSYFIEMVALGLNITLSKKILFRSRKEWVELLMKHKYEIIHQEHIKTLYGIFVPHSLFICKKVNTI